MRRCCLVIDYVQALDWCNVQVSDGIAEAFMSFPSQENAESGAAKVQ